MRKETNTQPNQMLKKRIIITNDLTVRFNEVDSYRIVHNTYYYNYFDIDRSHIVNLLFRRGTTYEYGDEWDQYYYLVLKSECKYKNYAKVGHVLKTQTEFKYDSTQQSAHLKLTHRIKNTTTKSTCVEGTTILGVCNSNYELLYKLPDELYHQLRKNVRYYAENPSTMIRIK